MKTIYEESAGSVQALNQNRRFRKIKKQSPLRKLFKTLLHFFIPECMDSIATGITEKSTKKCCSRIPYVNICTDSYTSGLTTREKSTNISCISCSNFSDLPTINKCIDSCTTDRSSPNVSDCHSIDKCLDSGTADTMTRPKPTNRSCRLGTCNVSELSYVNRYICTCHKGTQTDLFDCLSSNDTQVSSVSTECSLMNPNICSKDANDTISLTIDSLNETSDLPSPSVCTNSSLLDPESHLADNELTSHWVIKSHHCLQENWSGSISLCSSCLYENDDASVTSDLEEGCFQQKISKFEEVCTTLPMIRYSTNLVKNKIQEDESKMILPHGAVDLNGVYFIENSFWNISWGMYQPWPTIKEYHNNSKNAEKLCNKCRESSAKCLVGLTFSPCNRHHWDLRESIATVTQDLQISMHSGKSETSELFENCPNNFVHDLAQPLKGTILDNSDLAQPLKNTVSDKSNLTDTVLPDLFIHNDIYIEDDYLKDYISLENIPMSCKVDEIIKCCQCFRKKEFINQSHSSTKDCLIDHSQRTEDIVDVSMFHQSTYPCSYNRFRRRHQSSPAFSCKSTCLACTETQTDVSSFQYNGEQCVSWDPYLGLEIAFGCSVMDAIEDTDNVLYHFRTEKCVPW
ncbi:uncharacterized protein LOC106054861 isoform X2 [Biomphalaria glabrata]|uniref:Uncharacterized protein LOC106054861 isoform X2 n=1 Tax=Biomphalaria glabrata TaxID=6526 RepID=A0A9U8DYM1_BIOGL|nr:uncharacterized protein LOC106054861 isoform X2 [Biomphalaria glabrata]